MSDHAPFGPPGYQFGCVGWRAAVCTAVPSSRTCTSPTSDAGAVTALAWRLLLELEGEIRRHWGLWQMSALHHERVALWAEAPARFNTLLRRLMIVCPTTGRPADTGFELSSVPVVSARPQMLVDCLECGQDDAARRSRGRQRQDGREPRCYLRPAGGAGRRAVNRQ